MTTAMHPQVQLYLDEFEQSLKRVPGVAPEEAISDAREFLVDEWRKMSKCEPPLTDEELYAHFVGTFGEPDQVARAYRDEQSPRIADGGPPSAVGSGLAPGWRICCTKCGRSKPADQAGVVRLAARSTHKYTLGYCSACRRLRWLRLIRDLDQPTLARKMGVEATPDELRADMHRPWLTILVILALVIPTAIVTPLLVVMSVVARDGEQEDEQKGGPPDGWRLTKSIDVKSQLEFWGRKLGGEIHGLNNSFYAFQNHRVQVNRVDCVTDADADRVYVTLVKNSPNPRLVRRAGRQVYEFLCDDVTVALKARTALGIQPKRVTYRVRFDAAPLKTADGMQWNRMFNLFLKLKGDPQRREVVQEEIKRLRPHFEFSDTISLRQQGRRASWKLTPEPLAASTSGDQATFRLPQPPSRAGVPYVAVEGTVVSQTDADVASDRPADRLLAATNRWPVKHEQITAACREIMTGKKSDEEKLQAILAWHRRPENLRFGGPVTGSRYGVEKVLEQGFGHCWDFSDVFITMCRASGIPSRQVGGWLYGLEGHIWAEVWLDGKGWRQVDPTSGLTCDSDYVPIVISEDGEFPLLYVSPVNIQVLKRE